MHMGSSAIRRAEKADNVPFSLLTMTRRRAPAALIRDFLGITHYYLIYLPLINLKT